MTKVGSTVALELAMVGAHGGPQHKNIISSANKKKAESTACLRAPHSLRLALDPARLIPPPSWPMISIPKISRNKSAWPEIQKWPPRLPESWRACLCFSLFLL